MLYCSVCVCLYLSQGICILSFLNIMSSALMTHFTVTKLVTFSESIFSVHKHWYAYTRRKASLKHHFYLSYVLIIFNCWSGLSMLGYTDPLSPVNHLSSGVHSSKKKSASTRRQWRLTCSASYLAFYWLEGF